MTARKRRAPSHLRTVTQEGNSVGDIPDRQLRCRAGHHAFPLDRWLPGEPFPRGITVMHASEGRLKIVEPCDDCKAVTGVTYTHPGGVFDGYLPRHIQYGPEWVRLAMDEPRSRRVMRDARYSGPVAARQIATELLSRVTTLEEADERRQRTGPPVIRQVQPVKFRGA